MHEHARRFGFRIAAACVMWALSLSSATAAPGEKPRLVVQLAHRSDVTAIATSADGRFILSGDSTGQIFLWDGPSGRALRELNPRTVGTRGQTDARARVAALGFSPDGAFATALRGHEVIVWTTADGRKLLDTRAAMPAADASAAAWAFSADSQQLFIGGRRWRRAPQGLAWEEPFSADDGSSSDVTSVALRGRRLAIARSSGKLAIEDLQGEQPAFNLQLDEHGLSKDVAPPPPERAAVDSSPPSQNSALAETLAAILLSGGVFELVHQKPAGAAPTEPAPVAPPAEAAPAPPADESVDARPGEPIAHLAWLSDDRILVVGLFGTVALLDVNQGKEVWHAALADAAERVTASPDGKVLVLYTKTSFRLLDAADGRELRHYARNRTALCSSFSADGRLAVTGHEDRTVRLWDATNGKLARKFLGAWGAVTAIAFLPSGKSLAAVDEYGVLSVWSLDDGTLASQQLLPRRSAQDEAGDNPPLAGTAKLRANEIYGTRTARDISNREGYEWLTRPRFVANGRLLFCCCQRGSDDNGAFDVLANKPLRFPPSDFEPGKLLAVSTDGRFVLGNTLTPGDTSWLFPARQYELWTTTGKRVSKIADDLFLSSPKRATISPDNVWVAIDDSGGGVRLVASTNGREYGSWATGLEEITDLAFSPRSTQVAIGGPSGDVQTWDRAGGKRLHTLKGHDATVVHVSFSPDGRTLLTTSADETVRLWDTVSGREKLKLSEPEGSLVEVTFLETGKLMLAFRDGALEVRDGHAGPVTARGQLCSRDEFVDAVGQGPGPGRIVVSSSWRSQLVAGPRLSVQSLGPDAGKIMMLDAARSRSTYQQIAAFRPGSSEIIAVSATGAVRTWNERGLASRHQLIGADFLGPDTELEFDAEYRHVAAVRNIFGAEPEYRVWDLASRQVLKTAKLSPSNEVEWLNERFAMKHSVEGAILTDAKTQRPIKTFPGSQNIEVSADNRRLLTSYTDGSLGIWDLKTFAELRRMKVATLAQPKSKNEPTPERIVAKFSPSGRFVLVNVLAAQRAFSVWNADTGAKRCDLQVSKARPAPPQEVAPPAPVAPPASKAEIHRAASARMLPVAWRQNDARPPADDQALEEGFSTTALDPTFSADEKWLVGAIGYSDHDLVIWDAETGQLARTIPTPVGPYVSPTFSPDAKLVLQSGTDDTIYLWERDTGKLACRLLMLDDNNWAVVDPEGRFDAPNGGAVAGLHWVIDNEPVDLEQLKERYYEPELLGKKLGTVKEVVRNVQAFENPKLAPAVKVHGAAGDARKVAVQLANRGGGIGRVVVKLNGKEILPDARGPRPDPDAKQVELQLDLSQQQRLTKAGRNVVEVEVYNTEGYMRSRGLEYVFEAPESEAAVKPHVWLVACGVTNYRDNQRLRSPYASKDAQDISQALRVAAERLFGPERVHSTVLSSYATEPQLLPSRENLIAAIDGIREATTDDILVVYLAGHGITTGGDDGDFYFLCSDAVSDELRDVAVRDQVALSSATLTDLIKKVPALKQVMILDTCAAGRVIEELNKKRDVPSGQTRALDRLKDRTGMYVLAGCAADAVSYEASRYAQGVLTYSLLMGLRGAALRDEQFVDVERLFNYSIDMVPTLAGDIGGIQRPRLSAPNGSSFDIGELTPADRGRVPLQTVRPLVLRTSFQEETTFDDTLNLSKLVDDQLRDAASSPDAAYVFVDGRGLPDSYRMVGRYTVDATRASVAANVFYNTLLVRKFTITGKPQNPLDIARKLHAEFELTKPTERSKAAPPPSK